MLLLTAATVAVYASDPLKEGPLPTRVAASSTTDVSATIDVQMQQFRTSVLNTVSGLQAEKDTLESNLREQQADSQRFFQQLQEAQQREQTVREELAKAQREHEAALAKAQSSMDAAVQAAVTAKQTQLGDLQREFDSVIAEKNAASEKLSASEKSLAELQSAAAANKSIMDNLRSELDQAKAGAKTATEHNTQLSATLAATQEEITTKAGMLADAEKKLADQEALVEILGGRLRGATEEGSASSQLARELQQQLTDAEKTIQDASSAVAKLEQELDALRADRNAVVIELTGKLEAVKGEHEALQGQVALYNNFMSHYSAAANPPTGGGITRTPSGVFEDWQKWQGELPETQKALNAAEQRADAQESEFGQRMAAMSQEMEQLKATIAGNAAALAELDQLRTATASVATEHQQAIETLRAEHAAELVGMVKAEELDAAQLTVGSLNDQLRNVTSARNDLQAQVARFTQMIKSMEESATGNEALLSKLRQQNQELVAAKAAADRKEADDAQALQVANQQRDQEAQAKQAARAAASKAAGVRSKADIDAERAAAANAVQSRIAMAEKVPTAVQLVPVWQFLRDIASSTNPALGLASDSTMNGPDGTLNRNKLAGQSLVIKGKKIIVPGVEPAQIWPAIRKLAADLGVPNYDQLGAETLVQEIKKAAQ